MIGWAHQLAAEAQLTTLTTLACQHEPVGPYRTKVTAGRLTL
jgi:hypothetical protein